MREKRWRDMLLGYLGKLFKYLKGIDKVLIEYFQKFVDWSEWSPFRLADGCLFIGLGAVVGHYEALSYALYGTLLMPPPTLFLFFLALIWAVRMIERNTDRNEAREALNIIHVVVDMVNDLLWMVRIAYFFYLPVDMARELERVMAWSGHWTELVEHFIWMPLLYFLVCTPRPPKHMPVKQKKEPRHVRVKA